MRMMRGFVLLLATTVVPTMASAQTYPTNKDPRSTLKPGRFDAGIAISNMKQVSFVKKPAAFDSAAGLKFINSDMAFGTHYVYQANFAGFTIWDITDPAQPRQLGPPLQDGDAVADLAFTPNGNTLVTATEDGTTRLWDLRPLRDVRAHVAETACHLAGRGLNPDEWARYITGLDYIDSCR